MSVGSNLQEMENVVTKGAAAADPMPKQDAKSSGVTTPQTGSWKILVVLPQKTIRPMTTLRNLGTKIATVKDIVNRGAKADPMPKMA